MRDLNLDSTPKGENPLKWIQIQENKGGRNKPNTFTNANFLVFVSS